MKTKNNIAIDHIFFDWDGTLLNTFEADANAYAYMFDALGMDWSIEELKRHYSPTWHLVYRAAGIPRAKWDEADRLWRKVYQTQLPKMQLGATSVLLTLVRQFRLPLLSSASRARVRKQRRAHNGSAMFLTKV